MNENGLHRMNELANRIKELTRYESTLRAKARDISYETECSFTSGQMFSGRMCRRLMREEADNASVERHKLEEEFKQL